MHEYIISLPYSLSHTLPSILLPSTGITSPPQKGPVLPSCPVFEKNTFLFKISIWGVSL
jgi:hypothetical protein